MFGEVFIILMGHSALDSDCRASIITSREGEDVGGGRDVAGDLPLAVEPLELRTVVVDVLHPDGQTQLGLTPERGVSGENISEFVS